jgi:Kef-type K+ transport system membrane component KefB
MYTLLFVMLELPRPEMTSRNSIRPVGPLPGVLCVAAAIDIGAGWLLGKPSFGSHARIILATLPIPANLALVVVIVRRIRQLDEFLRQVHLEAIAIAFLLTVLAASVYEDLQKAHVVGSLNVGMVWIFMAAFYGVGYVIAVRHYR